MAYQRAHSEDSDQTGRMPMLICVFAGRMGHFVGFVMLWLIGVESAVTVNEPRHEKTFLCHMRTTMAQLTCASA